MRSASSQTACTPSVLLDHAVLRWSTDDATAIEDAYKWLFQATRGGEHAAPDAESARKWLEREWASLGEAKENEPFWESLCPCGEIGRLNLRPFRDRGGSREALLDAFMTSCGQFAPDKDAFIAAWTELGRRLTQGVLGVLSDSDWLEMELKMREEGYPAVHHSVDYRNVYTPAYRVITNTEYQRLAESLHL